jgi:hypothetical protein
MAAYQIMMARVMAFPELQTQEAGVVVVQKPLAVAL